MAISDAQSIETELAALSDQAQLSRIKRISIELERFHERTPSDDVSFLQKKLATIFDICRRIE